MDKIIHEYLTGVRLGEAQSFENMAFFHTTEEEKSGFMAGMSRRRGYRII